MQNKWMQNIPRVNSILTKGPGEIIKPKADADHLETHKCLR